MSRRDVIRKIVQRDQAHLDLSERVVAREAKPLFEKACECFGTWETALSYAGVNSQHMGTTHGYSRTQVTRTLRRLCISGYRLSASHIMRRNRRLYKAALRHFKTWNGALEAAGINPDGLDRQRAQADYDKRAVIEFLRDRQQAGLPVAWGQICLEKQFLAVVAKRLFGNWRNTLIAAGIPPERPHGRTRKP